MKQEAKLALPFYKRATNNKDVPIVEDGAMIT